jgi:hypothetical protein
MANNVGDVIRVDVIGSMNSVNEVVNTYQFRIGGAGALTDTELLDDVLVFIRALYDAIKGLFTAIVVWRRIRAYNLTQNTLIGEEDFATAVTGTASGEQGAYQVAGLVSFKTNIARVVMRKYLPLAEGYTNNTGTIEASAVTLLNTFGTTLLAPFTGSSGKTYTFGYNSPKTGGFIVPNGRTTSLTPVIQRRRRPGVGS